MKLELWTDGSSGGGVSTGGWGFIGNDGRLKGSGGAPETTNQRMELAAAGKALRAALNDEYYENYDEIEVVSDSRYLVDCFGKQWYVKWVRNGWRSSSGDPVKNADLWLGLIQLVKSFEDRGAKVTFRWIKGHAGHDLNEKADELARHGKERMKEHILKQTN